MLHLPAPQPAYHAGDGFVSLEHRENSGSHKGFDNNHILLHQSRLTKISNRENSFTLKKIS
jgi:hypothetical protein